MGKKTIRNFLIEKQEVVVAGIIILRFYASDIFIALEKVIKYYPKKLKLEIKSTWLYPKQALHWYWFKIYQKPWLNDEHHHALDDNCYITASQKREQLARRQEKVCNRRQKIINDQHYVLDEQIAQLKNPIDQAD